MRVSEENEGWRSAARRPGLRRQGCFLFSEPVPVGDTGSSGKWQGTGGGWVGRMAERPLLGSGVQSPSPLERQVVRALGRGGRRQGPAPRPSAPPGVHSPAARPTRGARQQRPAWTTWPCKGRRPGPPATRLALRRICGAFRREGVPSTAAASPSLFHSPPPSIVPQRGGPGPRALLGARRRPGSAGVSRRRVCGRGAVTALLLRVPFYFSREKKKVVVNVF